MLAPPPRGVPAPRGPFGRALAAPASAAVFGRPAGLLTDSENGLGPATRRARGDGEPEASDEGEAGLCGLCAPPGFASRRSSPSAAGFFVAFGPPPGMLGSRALLTCCAGATAFAPVPTRAERAPVGRDRLQPPPPTVEGRLPAINDRVAAASAAASAPLLESRSKSDARFSAPLMPRPKLLSWHCTARARSVCAGLLFVRLPARLSPSTSALAHEAAAA